MHPRSAWVFALAGLSACTLRGSLEHLTGAACVEATDCPGSETSCQTRTCDDGRCAISYPQNLPVASQKGGNCLLNVCDGTGDIIEVTDESDVEDDANPCTHDTCASGNTLHQPLEGECELPDDTTGICDLDTGECVECLGHATPCSTGGCDGGCVCLGGACLPEHCNDELTNSGETDFNCGGPCNPCADHLGCEDMFDCVSLVCGADDCIGPPPCCQVPTCTDGQTNGDETDEDCGGGCPELCRAGEGCAEDSDCESGVCNAKVCQLPTCRDSTQNGEETDEDCGGDDCDPCLPGQHCLVDEDCLGLQCRLPLMLCAPNCQDGIQNNDEVGVDCGPGCNPCPIDGLRTP